MDILEFVDCFDGASCVFPFGALVGLHMGLAGVGEEFSEPQDSKGGLLGYTGVELDFKQQFE
jgi:hypothetical protein